MPEKRRRFKIYRDEAKERLTNHWDWDYMGYDSTKGEQSPLLMPQSPSVNNTEPTPSKPSLWSRICSFFVQENPID